jgi:hypothetical protein
LPKILSTIGSIRFNKTKKNLSSVVSNYPNYQKLAKQGSVFLVLFKNWKLRHYVFHLSLNTEVENAEGYIFHTTLMTVYLKVGNIVRDKIVNSKSSNKCYT